MLTVTSDKTAVDIVRGGKPVASLAAMRLICGAIGIDPSAALVTSVVIDVRVDEAITATITTLPTDKQLAAFAALWDGANESTGGM